MALKLDFEQRKRAEKLMERMVDDDCAAEIAFDYIHLQDVNATLLEALKAVTDWAGKDAAKLRRLRKMTKMQYMEWTMQTLNQSATAILKAQEK